MVCSGKELRVVVETLRKGTIQSQDLRGRRTGGLERENSLQSPGRSLEYK